MPEELPSIATPITLEQAHQALHDGWKKALGADPKAESVRLLVAHWGFETNWGKDMRCYNFGNARKAEGDPHDWTFYECTEYLAGKPQQFKPKHPQTRFRAFRSLMDGATEHVKLLNKKYGNAWPAVLAANPSQFARQLKVGKYYTDTEAHYTKSIVDYMSYAAKAQWPPKDGKKVELPGGAPLPKEPFGAHQGADYAIAAYERAIGATGFKLDADSEKNWKVEEGDDGPGNFEKKRPLAGDLALVATADGPRGGRVVTVVAPQAKTYEGGVVFVAGVKDVGVGVEKLTLESRPNGFDPNKGDAWGEGETRPGSGKAWVLRVLRLGEATPALLAGMSDEKLKKWSVKKGEVVLSPGTDIRWDAKKKPNDPTIVDQGKEPGKPGAKPKGKGASPDDDPKKFKVPPPVIDLPPPKQIDARTVQFKVGNYPGRVAFTIRRPGEPLPPCPPPGAPKQPAAAGKRDDFVRAALNLLGAPFLAGSRDPGKGLDGPGLVSLCMKRVGLFKSDDEMTDGPGLHALFGSITAAADKPPDEIIPGDLAWFGDGAHDVSPHQHCMLYLGGGRVLGPIPDGGPQNGAVQVIPLKDVPERFVGWSHIADLGRDTGHTEHPGSPPKAGDAVSGALLPASPASRYESLKAMVQKQGGAWDDGKGKVNLVSVRGMHSRSLTMALDGGWNDTIFACFLDDDGHKCSLELKASVNPGTDKEKAGKWHLVDGSYKFKLADGAGGKVLQPEGKVKGWHDEHGLGALRPGDLKPPPEGDKDEGGGEPEGGKEEGEEPKGEEAKGEEPKGEEPKEEAKGEEPKEEAKAKEDEPDDEQKKYGECVPKGKKLHPKRKKAIEIACSQVGLVSTRGGVKERKGWERLMEYHDVGFPLAGAKESYWRPYPFKQGKGQPWAWCGVFCTWALIKAGVTENTWRGPKGKIDGLLGTYKVRSDYDNIVPGDILIHKDFWHHSMCTAKTGKNLTIVQGNGECEEITHVPLNGGSSKLQGYLRILDEDYV